MTTISLEDGSDIQFVWGTNCFETIWWMQRWIALSWALSQFYLVTYGISQWSIQLTLLSYNIYHIKPTNNLAVRPYFHLLVCSIEADWIVLGKVSNWPGIWVWMTSSWWFMQFINVALHCMQLNFFLVWIVSFLCTSLSPCLCRSCCNNLSICCFF